MGSAGRARPALRAPVHPDTLPTLEQTWILPASLAGYTKNTYVPRMTLSGMLLYVYDHHGRRLVAVQAGTGKVVWHQPVVSRSNLAFAFTPLVARNRVYVSNHGFLYAFNALDGKLRWKIPTKGLAVNGLARSKHRLFLPWVKTAGRRAIAGVNLWAVDSRTGRVEWSKKLPGKMAFIMGDSDGAYFVGSTGMVLGLTSDRGDYKWQLRVEGKVVSPPILKGGRLYVTTLRRKAGWRGTGIYVVDIKKGKLLWKTKLPARRVSAFLFKKQLVTVAESGELTLFDNKGKKSFNLDLNFMDQPRKHVAVSIGKRAFVFSSHADGNGYIRLVDLENKRLLAAANALDMDVNSVIGAGKLLFLDGIDGTVYAFRLDRSKRPRRGNVPPREFAEEMLKRVEGATEPIKGLAPRLAGLGLKALPAIEPALQSQNPHVAHLAAEAIGLLGSKRSVPGLLRGAKKLLSRPPVQGPVDPLLAVIGALAELKDGRAVGLLKKVVQDQEQDHFRRRAAYVALGAIGSPAALNAIWALRAAKGVAVSRWSPVPFTASTAHLVEEDAVSDFEHRPEKLHKRTAITIQTKTGQIITAALSPYLGGYNDIWVGQSDLSGYIQNPMFTGLTKPELVPNRRIRLKKLRQTGKGALSLVIQMKQGKSWVSSRPVSLDPRVMMADQDKDGLPDMVERRLHLCVINPDCDGDGLKDAEDLNPLASAKQKLTLEQRLFQETFFSYFVFLKRRGVVVVDPGNGPSFEVYGRSDPVLSLRRPTIERLRKQVGLHATDYVSFGGPYPEGGGSGDALAKVVYNKKKTEATVGMDIFRSGENAVAYNVTLKKVGKNWVVRRFHRIWTTN